MFKSYMEFFHEKSLDKTKGDEVVIYGNVNEIDKRFKEKKTTEKKTWEFGIFPFGRDHRY